MGEPARYRCLSDPTGLYSGSKFHKLDFEETLGAGLWPQGSIWHTPDGYALIEGTEVTVIGLQHMRQILHNRRQDAKRRKGSGDYYGRPNPPT